MGLELVGSALACTVSGGSGIAGKLELTRVLNNQYLLLDTRAINNALAGAQIISHNQALAVLINRPVAANFLPEETRWALHQNFLVKIDGWYVSLVTADPELISEFNSSFKEYASDAIASEV